GVPPAPPVLSFPTRRSSDLISESRGDEGYTLTKREDYHWPPAPARNQGPAYLDKIEVRHIQDNSIAAAELRSGGLDLLHNTEPADRKSTRLHSSHVKSSYAV